ncbi:putative acyl-CoA dehydrogenase [compost metagenome]
MKLEQEQEVLSHLADIMIAVYAMESALLRTKKQIERAGEAKSETYIDMTTAFIHEEFARIDVLAKEVLSYMESGDMLRTQLSVLKKLTKRTAVNTLSLKRRIAAKVIEAEEYVL